MFKKRKEENQQDITRQQQQLVATSPWSGFMWGIKQGFMHSVCTLGRAQRSRHHGVMQNWRPLIPPLPFTRGQLIRLQP